MGGASAGSDPTSAIISEQPPTLANSAVLIVVAVLIGLGGYYWMQLGRKSRPSRSRSDYASTTETSPTQSKHKSGSSSKGKKPQQQHHKASAANATKEKERATQHPLYITTLKGFQREVTSLSINTTGTKIVVASSDSSIRVFTVDPEHPVSSLEKQSYIRGIISADYCTAIDLSVDDQYVFGATELSCKLVKLAQKKSVTNTDIYEQVAESKNAVHKGSVRWLSSSKGRWIVTASENDDTEIKVFNYSLDLLGSIDTKQVKNFHLAVSPMDGRFFGSASWSPGVKVMEIVSQRQGEFKKLEKAMDLGTPCGVNAVAFNLDNSKAILACKDGTLILWNIDIRYQANEDPKKLLTVKEEFTSDFKGYSQLQFNCDGSMIIGISNKSIRILKTLDLSVVEIIEDAHAVPIRSLSVSPTGNFFSTGAIDPKPRVWELPSSP